jgi:hypothetical protein
MNQIPQNSSGGSGYSFVLWGVNFTAVSLARHSLGRSRGSYGRKIRYDKAYPVDCGDVVLPSGFALANTMGHRLCRLGEVAWIIQKRQPWRRDDRNRLE